MDEEKWEFINNEILAASIFAALARGRKCLVYNRKEGASEKKREEFKDFLRKKLREYAKKYKNEKVSDDKHFKNTEKLAEEISEAYGEIFVNGRFRIGRTQKLLNLYLKYLWCLGKISEPPHCPFDSTVIGKLDREARDTRFAKFDDIDTYKKLVEAARNKASEVSLPEWELKLFNKENYRT